MMRSMWSAASGMTAQQLNLDTISHNLANVNTTGFKRSRAEFQDLLYQTLRVAGTPIEGGSEVPTGIQIGIGTQLSATVKDHSQGSVIQTGNAYDMAIVNGETSKGGEGFFQIILPDGTMAYTRDGSFKRSSDGRLSTADGFLLQPEIIIPDIASGTDPMSLTVTGEGIVSIMVNNEPQELGRIQLAAFVNPAGLNSIGQNLYTETGASGTPAVTDPGSGGTGIIGHKKLEISNVNIVEEMVLMITAQRAYELNSKAIQTSDQMLGIANTLKR